MRTIAIRSCLALLSAFVGLLVGETALRIGRFCFVPQASFFVSDPDTGWANRPGAKGIWRYEGGGLVEINSHGLRDRERSYIKPPKSFRVAVLGDSFTAAFQVNQNETFCNVAERLLLHCPVLKGKIPEVINFGVNAYGTAQELIVLEKDVWLYCPDLVVLAFYPNDLCDNSRRLAEIYSAHGLEDRPYFHLARGRLVSDGVIPKRTRASLKRKDTAYAEALHRRLWDLRLWQLFALLRSGWSPMEEPVADRLLNPPVDEEWTEAWNLTEALISAMAEECRERGVPLLLVAITHPLQVYPGSDVRNTLLRHSGVIEPFYVNRRLATLADRNGIAFLSLAEEMVDFADAHGSFFHGFSSGILGHGHWNGLGHRFAGERIAQAICQIQQGGEAGAHACVRPTER
jgi:hypothetical protein